MVDTKFSVLHFNTKDLTGQKFGRLTVLKYAGKSSWLCRCDCGKEKRVRTSNLNGNKTKSCGCYRDDRIRETCGTLAGNHPAEYKTWCGIKRRCLNCNEQAYQHYGAQGIMICDKWCESFEAFYADMGPKPSPKHTIDRIDNSKGYEPNNCRWATRRQQAQNTKKATTLTYNGVTKPTPDWARQFDIKLQTLHGRLKSGWSVQRALSTPVATR